MAGYPSNEDLRREAANRNALHRNAGQPHQWAGDDLEDGKSDYIGLLGEREFVSHYGLPLDLSKRVNGDSHDGILPTKHGPVRFDVKTYRKPGHLLAEARRCKRRTMYVLVKYWEKEDRAELLGWQWGKFLMESPARDFGGKGIISYGCLASKLRPIKEIDEVAIWQTNTAS